MVFYLVLKWNCITILPSFFFVNVIGKKNRYKSHRKRNQINYAPDRKRVKCDSVKQTFVDFYETVNSERHLFSPLDADARSVSSLLYIHQIIFIRSGIACDKFTMTRYLAKADDKWMLVTNPNHPKFQTWVGTFFNAYLEHPKLAERVKESDNKEETQCCHKVLLHYTRWSVKTKSNSCCRRDPDPPLVRVWSCCSAILEPRENTSRKDLRVLFFSNALNSQGKLGTTPKGINKYIWTPTVPAASKICKDLCTLHLDHKVHVDESSMNFILRFCLDHFGITMAVLYWIRDKQWGTRHKKWNFETTVITIRNALNEGWGMETHWFFSLYAFSMQSWELWRSGSFRISHKSLSRFFLPDRRASGHVMLKEILLWKGWFFQMLL